MDDTESQDALTGNVLVFRNSASEPIAVPSDVVTAAERAYRVYTERLGGKSWDEIASQEQYPSGAAAKADVDRYMAEAKALVMEQSQRDMLTLEVARLDALQAAVWPMAMKGHIPSAQFALSVIKERIHTTVPNLEALQASEGDQSRTVVVPSTDDGYTAALMKAAGDTPG